MNGPKKPGFYYTDWSNTPLNYYRFLRIAFPVTLILNILTLFAYIMNRPESDPTGLFWSIVAIESAFVIAKGVSISLLWQRRWSCILPICIGYLLQIIDKILKNVFVGASAGTYIGSVLGVLGIAIPTYIYLKRRRFFFLPIPAAIPRETYEQQEQEMKQFHSEKIEEPSTLSDDHVEKPDGSATAAETLPAAPIPDLSEPISPPKIKKRFSKIEIVCLLLAVACVSSLVGNAVQGYQMAKWQSNYQTEVDNLKKDLKKQRELVSKMKETRSELRQQNEDLKESNKDLAKERLQFSREFYFFATSIGFIVDGSKYYHNYNCPVFKAADTFWAHNFEYCKYLGYPKCPVCNGEDGDLELAPDETDKPVFKKVS